VLLEIFKSIQYKIVWLYILAISGISIRLD